MHKSRVTCVVANHNYGRYLKGALDSCLNQTYPCSIIYIDDGSTDESWDVACETLLGEKKERGHYLLSEFPFKMLLALPQPTGPSIARNLGIEHTIEHTDAFAILDADDYMYPEKVEKCIHMMMSAPQVGIVYGDYHIFNTETNTLLHEFKESYDYYRIQQECIIHSGSLVSAEAMMHAKKQDGYYYDPEMRTCEDWDLWLRIVDNFNVFHIAEPLTFVRVTPLNSTRSVKQEIWKQNWERIRHKQHAKFKLRQTN